MLQYTRFHVLYTSALPFSNDFPALPRVVSNGFLRDAYNLPCSHTFCRECIDDALADNNLCPTCLVPAWQKDTLKTALTVREEEVLICLPRAYRVLSSRSQHSEGGFVYACSNRVGREPPSVFALLFGYWGSPGSVPV